MVTYYTSLVPRLSLTPTKNKHIIIFIGARGEPGNEATLQVHLLLCVTAHSPFPLPGMVGVSRLYWGAVGVATPDWLVPITNG